MAVTPRKDSTFVCVSAHLAARYFGFKILLSNDQRRYGLARVAAESRDGLIRCPSSHSASAGQFGAALRAHGRFRG
jgi:hypothetical protein